jgi:hypothetical protein
MMVGWTNTYIDTNDKNKSMDDFQDVIRTPSL